MALVDVDVIVERIELPPDIAEFLDAAQARTDDYLTHGRIRTTSFVPCDFVVAYYALRTVAQLNLATGSVFCEWGSGMGAVASLAGALGFDSFGIEIEEALVEASRELAEAHSFPVEFAHGSYVPEGAEFTVDEEYSDEPFFLEGESDGVYDDLGISADDLDVVFTYPWPSEENAVARLFEYCAGDGALLLTYTQLDEIRIRRKQGPSQLLEDSW